MASDQALAATAAFGQGFGSGTVIASPLQMALVAAGIANQGVIMTPHVMEQIRDSQGNLVETYAPKPWLTATSPLTASAVTTLMQGVATHGTAQGVFPASWNVAAKTGTAETGTGPLGNSLTNDWMIAFAPANNPQGGGGRVRAGPAPSETGAKVSGPPARDILGYALGDQSLESGAERLPIRSLSRSRRRPRRPVAAIPRRRFAAGSSSTWEPLP